MKRILPALLAFALLGAAPASASEVKAGDLTLSGLWTRATPPKAPTAGGYLTIANAGDTPDRLVAVATPLAGVSEIHEMKVENGIMTMRPLDGGLPIPAHGSVALAPGGFHLMFMKLAGPIEVGGSLPVTLTFEKAGPVEATLAILPIGAPGPGGTGGHGAATGGAPK